jgi:hypothetical protein
VYNPTTGETHREPWYGGKFLFEEEDVGEDCHVSDDFDPRTIPRPKAPPPNSSKFAQAPNSFAQAPEPKIHPIDAKPLVIVEYPHPRSPIRFPECKDGPSGPGGEIVEASDEEEEPKDRREKLLKFCNYGLEHDPGFAPILTKVKECLLEEWDNIGPHPPQPTIPPQHTIHQQHTIPDSPPKPTIEEVLNKKD